MGHLLSVGFYLFVQVSFAKAAFAAPVSASAINECPNIVGKYTCYNNKKPTLLYVEMQKLRHATIFNFTESGNTTSLAADGRDYPFNGEAGKIHGAMNSYCHSQSLISRISATNTLDDGKSKIWQLLRRIDLDYQNNLRWTIFGYQIEIEETNVVDETFVCIKSDNQPTTD